MSEALPTSTAPRRASLARMMNQSTVLLMFAIGSLILLLAMLILFHQNANATKGYMLRNLELERRKLMLQEEVMNMQLAGAQALRHLEEDKQIQVMVSIRNPLYTEQDPAVKLTYDEAE